MEFWVSMHLPFDAFMQQLATLASLCSYHNKDYMYPKEKIDALWEKVLLNQCKSSNLNNFSKVISFYSP